MPEILRICNITFYPEFFFKWTHQIKEMLVFPAALFIEPYMTKDQLLQKPTSPALSGYEGALYLEELMKEYQEKKEGWKEAINSTFLLLVVFLSREIRFLLSRKSGVPFRWQMRYLH